MVLYVEFQFELTDLFKNILFVIDFKKYFLINNVKMNI